MYKTLKLSDYIETANIQSDSASVEIKVFKIQKPKLQYLYQIIKDRETPEYLLFNTDDKTLQYLGYESSRTDKTVTISIDNLQDSIIVKGFLKGRHFKLVEDVNSSLLCDKLNVILHVEPLTRKDGNLIIIEYLLHKGQDGLLLYKEIYNPSDLHFPLETCTQYQSPTGERHRRPLYRVSTIEGF